MTWEQIKEKCTIYIDIELVISFFLVNGFI